MSMDTSAFRQLVEIVVCIFCLYFNFDIWHVLKALILKDSVPLPGKFIPTFISKCCRSRLKTSFMTRVPGSYLCCFHLLRIKEVTVNNWINKQAEKNKICFHASPPPEKRWAVTGSKFPAAEKHMNFITNLKRLKTNKKMLRSVFVNVGTWLFQNICFLNVCVHLHELSLFLLCSLCLRQVPSSVSWSLVKK